MEMNYRRSEDLFVLIVRLFACDAVLVVVH
jgi:hypothetical protein